MTEQSTIHQHRHTGESRYPLLSYKKVFFTATNATSATVLLSIKTFVATVAVNFSIDSGIRRNDGVYFSSSSIQFFLLLIFLTCAATSPAYACIGFSPLEQIGLSAGVSLFCAAVVWVFILLSYISYYYISSPKFISEKKEKKKVYHFVLFFVSILLHFHILALHK
jgi:hypothetical protein